MTLRSRHRLLFAVLATGVAMSDASNGQSPQLQAVAGLTQYTFGTPSSDETEILAYINRLRANPAAERQRVADGVNAAFPDGSGSLTASTLLAEFQT